MSKNRLLQIVNRLKLTPKDKKDLVNIIESDQEVSLGTPDWNANKGEAGYIENRTHYHEKINIVTVSKENITSEPYDIGPMNNSLYYYEEGQSEHFIKLKYQYKSIDSEIEWTKTSALGPPISLAINFGHLYIKDEFGYNRNNFTFFNIYTKYLNENYLPDTVLKTTPQELSDDDKNQALTNLGIDPVIWKYICNPFVIKIETDCYVPEELVDLDTSFNSADYGKKVYAWKYLIPAMYMGYDDMEGNYFAVTYGEPSHNVPTLAVGNMSVYIDEEFKVVW